MLELNRRDTLLLTTAGLTWTLALGGCDKIFEKIKNRPVRRDVRTMANNDPMLQTYRDGIAAMQALPASDPRNWATLAAVHLNTCPHGNWFFLPWHRAYLMSIEAIIRKLTGNAGFAMPYWNWQCQRAIPGPFWQAGSILNPATPASQPPYAFTRGIGPSDQADESMVGPATLTGILSETDFELFASGAATALRGGGGSYGGLEATPHNYVHGFISGTMGGFLSPKDPIFWLHHNVLDYFWYAWNSMGNANTGDSFWNGFDLTMFVDGDGNPATYKVGALPLAPLISYRFEPPTGCIRPFDRVDDVRLKVFLEKARQIRFKPVREFPIPPRPIPPLDGLRIQRAAINLPPEAARAVMAEGGKERLLLRIDNVSAPAGTPFYIRVFVDLPADAEPSPTSPHYAGAFAFFGDDHHKMAFNTHVDLTKAVQRLAAERALSEEAPSISFVTVPIREQTQLARPVQIGGVTPLLIAGRDVPKPIQ